MNHTTHRAPAWRIGGFALNSLAANLYLLLMGFVSFAYMNFLGFGMIAIVALTMIFQVFDGITDPFFAKIIDKTNGKFGKHRPYMAIGSVLMFLGSCLLVHLPHSISGNTIVRALFLLIFGALFYVGYSFQTLVTRSAQSCLTNDPKQRPLFAAFDGLFTLALLAGAALIVPNMADANGGFFTAEFIHSLWLVVAIASAVLTALAIFAVAPKDNRSYCGKSSPVSKEELRAAWKDNQALRMLAFAASADKLALFTGIGAFTILNAMSGFHLLDAAVIGWTAIPAAILGFLAAVLAGKLGQKEALRLASFAGIVLNAVLACLWLFGDPTAMANGWCLFTIVYVVGTALLAAFRTLSGNLLIPMTADCVDYECYRTGRNLPALLSAMISRTEKLAGALAPLVVCLSFLLGGWLESGEDASASEIIVIFLVYGMSILGLICNLLAMKGYPLTKDKMAQIHTTEE